ncbi:APH(3')-II family aminoglycoside O-phosphotransferase [Burkholderia contaminans]|uniref:APH(3')-II family aminoglycoside O-phosphotransferase n=1 Tax=Burkholderia contaminans TaxID=488447 RepID=UPI001FC8F2B8|nr:APH(3') family aminoglycoside O-phosphotransferase [Burkholderia contaminans]
MYLAETELREPTTYVLSFESEASSMLPKERKNIDTDVNIVNEVSDNLLFPAAWHAYFLDGGMERQTVGESRADVFRLRRQSGAEVFVKSERADSLSELPQEIARLRWMRQVGLPCPQVLEATTENGRHWLLMTAVAGRDLASAANLAPAQIVQIIAQALRSLHAIPWERCPFDHRPGQRVIDARARVEAQVVDEANFDNERLGRTAADVFAELLSSTPDTVDAVVVHGDACLPNLMADGSTFSGFIDCGRLGVSDRYQDLALATRSITRNLGQQWVAPFFDVYGVVPDMRRIRFYNLLDEFF